MGKAIYSFFCATILWLAPVIVSAELVINPASVRQLLQTSDVAAIDSGIAKLAADRHVSELAFRLDDIAGDRSLHPVARAWLLNRGLHELVLLAPTPEARSVVLELSHRKPEVFTKVDPDHGDRTTPLYDTGATARFVLRSWQRESARTEAREDLASGRVVAVDRFAAADNRTAAGDAIRAGIIEAYADAPLPQLLSQRDTLAAAMTSGAHVDELALVLARRLADVELATLVLGRADPSIALAAIYSLLQVFEANSALEMLVHASGRAEISSAAMLEIGLLARYDRAARTVLLESLEDPDLGPSAAAALAGIGDPAVPAEVGQRLRASRSDWSRRMYVLALKLDSSPAARQELHRFLETGRGPPQFRREVRQWLER